MSGPLFPPHAPPPAGLPLRFRLSIAAPPGRSTTDELSPTLGSTLADIALLGPPRRLFNSLTGRDEPNEKEGRMLVKEVEGVVQQGELLLIVGPPLAPTSLLLRALSSPSDIHPTSNSHIDYGLLQLDWAPYLRSCVVYLSPHETNFPTLSLSSALLPCAESKTPRGAAPNWASDKFDGVVEDLGLAHAKDTPFGSAVNLAHGMSGGEQKRAAVAEALLTDAAVVLLDSPTSGLDSSTALTLLSHIRKTAIEGKKSVVMAAPQVSDRLLEQFDKILVMNDNGEEVFFGPVGRAKGFFEGLTQGFKQGEDEETVTFLSECATRGGRSLVKAWQTSPDRQELLTAMAGEYEDRYASDVCADPFVETLRSRKSRWVVKSSQWTVPFWTQVKLLTRRQYSLVWAEAKTYGTKTSINIALSFLVGTLFWRLPPTTDAAFTRGSLLLLSIMFNAYLSLAELGKTLEGRPIVKRQSDYGFFGASALAIARLLGDLPLILAQVVLFGTVTYVSAGLQPSWERFGVYIVFVYATALNLSCMFRLFAALSPSFEIAIRFCGVALNILVILAGYFIPARLLPAPLRFVHTFIDPISRAYEAVLANEFHSLTLACSPAHIVPTGPSYTDPNFQTCLLPGSTPRSLNVSGSAYLASAYDFHYSKIWTNLLTMVIQAVVFTLIGVIATDYLHYAPQGTKRMWSRTKAVKKLWERRWSKQDEEGEDEALLSGGIGMMDGPETTALGEAEDEGPLETEGSVLVWKDVSLWVDTSLETRRLLDRISGCIRPGRVTALLGASGAGKSTLLNVLAGRSQGSVRGNVLVDGKVPDNGFYRSTGFVDQFDLLDDKSTVRESLEFSALLRQDRSIPRAEKLAYVDVVLDLLALTHLQDAIVGTPTAGLDLCSRKLLSIAVEVVSKPSILFADEPTTSLDSKSALRVLKLLRRLARTGLAVIATVHQPSAEGFATFDDVLLLQRGGKQLYFGSRADATSYFESIDTGVSTEHSNTADLLLEIAGSHEETHSSDAALADKLALAWRESEKSRDVQALLGDLSKTPVGGSRQQPRSAAVRTQCIELTKRVSRHFARDVTYSYTKLFTSTVVPVVIGLAFFQKGQQHSIVSLQNRMFSVFLLLFVPVVIMNVTIFKVVHLRGLWHARELPGKIYGRTAFATSLLVSELPYSILCAGIYFVIWYILIGFPFEASKLFYALAMIQIFWIFQSTWALWIVSISTSLGIVANLLPFFLVSMEAFNGALMPYAQMPMYWRWLYWISPFQWYVRGMLGVLLHKVAVVCAPNEIVEFATPPGTTCATYAAEYFATHHGVLLTPDSTTICKACPVTVGDQWLTQINVRWEDRWLSMAILASYAVLNIALFYLLVFFPPRLPAWFVARRKGQTAEQVAEERWIEEMEDATEVITAPEVLVTSARHAFV